MKNWKCWMFGHVWKYFEPATYIRTSIYSDKKIETRDFSKRKCIRCKIIEECLTSNYEGKKWRRIE